MGLHQRPISQRRETYKDVIVTQASGLMID